MVIVRAVGLLLKTEIEKLNSWPIVAEESEATLSAASGGSLGLIVAVLVGVAPTCVLVGVAPTCVLVGVAPTCVLVGVAPTCVLVGVAPTCVLVVVAPTCVLVGVAPTCVLVGVAPTCVVAGGGAPVPGGLVCVTRCSKGAAGAILG